MSAFYNFCPSKGLTARCFDQLSAKLTGTSIKVTAEEHNLGIFITLHKRNDGTYRLTNPAAHLGGLLRKALRVGVGDSCYIPCKETGLRTKIHPNPRRPGLPHLRAHPSQLERKDLFSPGSNPRPNEKEQILLLDLSSPVFLPKPRSLPPKEQQLPNESLRFWQSVTESIHVRQFSQATARKLEIEEGQR